VGRGKRAITCRLSDPRGAALVKRLAAGSDVVVENFRPGTLERWGLGPGDLAEVCERLVMLRISGFGQTGAMRQRPGFGTMAEAMSGFAHLNGSPDGPPFFPSTTLADGVAATFGAFGLLAGLLGQLRDPGTTGVQVVDMALFEGLFRLIPTQLPYYDHIGKPPVRPGNFLGSHGVLRNLYRTTDGVYFCVAAIGETPIRRVLDAIGAAELREELATAIARRADGGYEDYLTRADAAIQQWSATVDWETASAALDASGAVYQRIYDAADIAADPVFRERGDVISVADDGNGSLLMQGVVPKFAGYEHRVAHVGPRLGEHNAEVYGERLGLDSGELDALREQRVI
jgi:crotonobetainyl-CoA:carnitine CoA-transferase CaiB-like acyl-CoA transferase